jgi:predicted metal-dependent phosphoesterase TrpH
MINLRQHVSDMMVWVNLILPELADDHVRKMDQAEVERTFLELYVPLTAQFAEFDGHSEQERLAWAKELIRKAREVPPGEQAPLPLTPENPVRKEVPRQSPEVVAPL